MKAAVPSREEAMALPCALAGPPEDSLTLACRLHPLRPNFEWCRADLCPLRRPSCAENKISNCYVSLSLLSYYITLFVILLVVTSFKS